LAANAAINKLHKDWKELPGYLGIPLRLWTLLPGLAGAGSERAKLWGKVPAIGIPMIIAVAWLWVLACAVYSQTHPVAVGAAMGASQPSLHTDISKPVAPVSTRTP
jgi:peptidoglycan/LPS O-acetylase OafA/YrhL